MKCPVCAEAGERSKVFVLGSSSTMMACPPYYDEDGQYHTHNTNRVATQFRCSNRHMWTQHVPNTCACGWKQEIDTAPHINESHWNR